MHFTKKPYAYVKTVKKKNYSQKYMHDAFGVDKLIYIFFNFSKMVSSFFAQTKNG